MRLSKLKNFLFHIDELFFSMIESGRSIRAAPDKIFAQTFFEGIEKGLNCGLVEFSITSGNRKCPKKIFTLTFKMIGC